jgi:hypothetical protein
MNKTTVEAYLKINHESRGIEHWKKHTRLSIRSRAHRYDRQATQEGVNPDLNVNGWRIDGNGHADNKTQQGNVKSCLGNRPDHTQRFMRAL